MPVSRPTADGLADELAGLYRALEQELAAGIAKRLAVGLDAEDWQIKKLAAAGEVQRWIANTVRRAAGKNGKAAQNAIEAAFERGGDAAQRELAGRRRGKLGEVQSAIPGGQAINRLAHALTGQLSGAQLAIVRSASDAYRKVVAAPSALVLGGELTRRQAAERAWNHLLDQGFTGFVDRAGRRWSAAGYVEMATRTATAQAAVQGHLDRMAEAGIDLLIVSNASQECRLCRPWEGKVLSRGGPDGARTIEVESELTSDLVRVHVAGSFTEAVRAGLMHPQCRHSVSAYLPGLTKPITDTADPEGDAARQRLRYLEREVRHWKLREAGALTPGARAKAAVKIKERQAQIRVHVKAHDLTRRSDRERLDLGNKRTAGEPPAPAPTPPAPKPAPAPAAPPPPAPVVRKTTITMGTPEQTRIVEREYDRHAALAPTAMEDLKIIRTGSAAEMDAVGKNVVAFYRGGFDRELVMNSDPFSAADAQTARYCTNVNWWTKCPPDLAGGRQTLAHEIGHHIDLGAMRRGAHRSAEFVKLWQEIADRFGVGHPGSAQGGSLHYLIDLEGWFAQHKAIVTQFVSEYGSTNSREMLAEVWAEYSLMGDKARPAIKAIGARMREIAEMQESP